MLGKLMKYEFKASGRIFFPIYIGILVLAVINGLFNNYDIFQLEKSGFSFSVGNIQDLFFLVLFALFVSLFVLTIVLTIQRFKKNLLEDEGYLMFTLPVGTKSIILSKFLIALIFAILSGIVAVVSFILIGLISGSVNISEMINLLKGYEFSKLISSADIWKFFIYMFFTFILFYSTFILTIYLSISVGQFPQFNKHRVAAGVIAFFLINTVTSSIRGYINEFIFSAKYTDGLALPLETITKYDLLLTGLDILIIIIIFMATDWILNRKLNLE